MEKIVLANWKEYVRRGGVPEEKMGAIQRQETKRAFFGGFGAALMFLRENTPGDELTEPTDEDVEKMEYILDTSLEEIRQFFVDETVKQNHGLSPQ